MNTRIAILDLGTNTFHLLIAEKTGNTWTIIYRDRQAVKIGQGGINQGIILPDAEERAIGTLKHFTATLQAKQVGRVLAFGTSAIRVARNQQAFLARIQAETGIAVRVLSGDEEAQFIYYGVNKALQLENDKALIVDIGGGSVEFIIAGEGRMLWHTSLEIGAQRLMEKFHHHDPIAPQEIKALSAFLATEMKPVLQAIWQFMPKTLAGSSGTFDTLSDIFCLKYQIQSDPNAPETPLTIQGFEEIYTDLIQKDRNARMAIPGMIEMRVDMIVVACCLIRFLLDQHRFTSIRVSSYAMKEGILERLDYL